MSKAKQKKNSNEVREHIGYLRWHPQAKKYVWIKQKGTGKKKEEPEETTHNLRTVNVKVKKPVTAKTMGFGDSEEEQDALAVYESLARIVERSGSFEEVTQHWQNYVKQQQVVGEDGELCTVEDLANETGGFLRDLELRGIIDIEGFKSSEERAERAQQAAEAFRSQFPWFQSGAAAANAMFEEMAEEALIEDESGERYKLQMPLENYFSMLALGVSQEQMEIDIKQSALDQGLIEDVDDVSIAWPPLPEGWDAGKPITSLLGMGWPYRGHDYVTGDAINELSDEVVAQLRKEWYGIVSGETRAVIKEGFSVKEMPQKDRKELMKQLREGIAINVLDDIVQIAQTFVPSGESPKLFAGYINRSTTLGTSAESVRFGSIIRGRIFDYLKEMQLSAVAAGNDVAGKVMARHDKERLALQEDLDAYKTKLKELRRQLNATDATDFSSSLELQEDIEEVEGIIAHINADYQQHATAILGYAVDSAYMDMLALEGEKVHRPSYNPEEMYELKRLDTQLSKELFEIDRSDVIKPEDWNPEEAIRRRQERIDELEESLHADSGDISTLLEEDEDFDLSEAKNEVRQLKIEIKAFREHLSPVEKMLLMDRIYHEHVFDEIESQTNTSTNRAESTSTDAKDFSLQSFTKIAEEWDARGIWEYIKVSEGHLGRTQLTSRRSQIEFLKKSWIKALWRIQGNRALRYLQSDETTKKLEDKTQDLNEKIARLETRKMKAQSVIEGQSGALRLEGAKDLELVLTPRAAQERADQEIKRHKRSLKDLQRRMSELNQKGFQLHQLLSAVGGEVVRNEKGRVIGLSNTEVLPFPEGKQEDIQRFLELRVKRARETYVSQDERGNTVLLADRQATAERTLEAALEDATAFFRNPDGSYDLSKQNWALEHPIVYQDYGSTKKADIAQEERLQQRLKSLQTIEAPVAHALAFHVHQAVQYHRVSEEVANVSPHQIYEIAVSMLEATRQDLIEDEEVEYDDLAGWSRWLIDNPDLIKDMALRSATALIAEYCKPDPVSGKPLYRHPQEKTILEAVAKSRTQYSPVLGELELEEAKDRLSVVTAQLEVEKKNSKLVQLSDLLEDTTAGMQDKKALIKRLAKAKAQLENQLRLNQPQAMPIKSVDVLPMMDADKAHHILTKQQRKPLTPKQRKRIETENQKLRELAKERRLFDVDASGYTDATKDLDLRVTKQLDAAREFLQQGVFHPVAFEQAKDGKYTHNREVRDFFVDRPHLVNTFRLTLADGKPPHTRDEFAATGGKIPLEYFKHQQREQEVYEALQEVRRIKPNDKPLLRRLEARKRKRIEAVQNYPANEVTSAFATQIEVLNTYIEKLKAYEAETKRGLTAFPDNFFEGKGLSKEVKKSVVDLTYALEGEQSWQTSYCVDASAFLS